MGKAEAGSAKAIGNAIKAKGKLRWYCQVCEKQCRDENGFQAHCRSEPHMRKILLLGPKANSAISDFSNQFQSEFLLLLRTRHQTNRVRANVVYNEYIQDKHHVHMNSTHWVTLSGFIATLGKAGIVHVDEDEKGLWITWVDTRPETLARQAAAQKKERSTMDGEERERKMLAEQIERAKAQHTTAEESKGLEKKEGEKITLNLFGPSSTIPTMNEVKPSTTEIENSLNGNSEEPKKSSSFGTFSTPASKPITINPLKRPAPMNIFKSAKTPKTSSKDDEESLIGGGKKFMSEAERLMKEDQARKNRQSQGYKGMGPTRGGR
uniref:DNA/RNA-binding protein KIN17 n=1 Tax=Kwoniella pini CBS 10737 TaxID=1296096 RepID=A0A1B9HYF4_9TREE|nr:DNA/RNA-binding protein KIN17 [Kwoniella pini CBS 10737]OCF48294.1 DNA/RNA-binding protein KIN17 [Kwoniella pini CBS 10737]